MTQRPSSQTMSVQLVPMRVPEAIPATVVTESTWLDTPLDTPMSRVSLRLCPGEPSELVVQIHNPGDRPLQVDLRLEGEVPSDWCQIGLEGRELPPGQQMVGVLYFRIEADFFERHDALETAPCLKLDYRGQIHIQATQATTGQRQVQVRPFTLYIRPDSLYLSFLPEFYRDVDLIGRFLKLFELAFEPAVQTLDALWAHLDPLTTPQTLLPFLAHWVGWPSDVPWETATQRRLIRRAMELYRWRGTRRGLRLYLHLYTRLSLDQPDTPEDQRQISIQEVFNEGFVLGGARLGRDAIVGGGRPYHFTVRLRSPNPARLDRRLIHTIIEQEKPAFCTYDLIIERLPPAG